MNITVAGTGYVGLVTGVCLAELGHQVTCIDIQEEKIKVLRAGRSPIYEPGLEPLLQNNLSSGRLDFTTDPQIAYKNADIIFLAVGTPEQQDGAANLEYIQTAAYTIAQHIKKDVIVCTKSTVPVGTNDGIKDIIHCNKPPDIHAEVVSNPEFLREGSAIFDFFHADRIVIGSDSPEAASIIEQIYLPLKIPIMKTDRKSAEMIKYVSNAFLATKISFINEIATICEKVGANIEEVAYGVGKDRRIGGDFLQAGIGYGGSCFPKDTKALVQLAGNIQHPFDLLKAVINVNNRQQSLPVMKAKETLGSLKGIKVALLGLAFKPETDDVREAASLTIIKELLDEGAVVTAYDPVAIPNAQKVLGNTIEYTVDIRAALANAELAIIATEWDQIKHIHLDLYRSYMKEPVIIDGRNCYPLHEVQKYPITYVSVGRAAITNKYSMETS
ncbi:UDP-glucose/GDP-mannose dehydrogenase family protein [Bacillus sp. CECT 9360]|uniref:UDP-glucose dehydrogenase family protein n=1 Tax=Bacillus sp. CECT 9360 TaxID=2845821 RepID=UPI001E5CF2BA|nr:UDP-glucose/GDP-mannose dehydrogenase family protein [Bacillus sp. CECT 9360]CAH0347657.1 UDP-glucose 6-dehydrogenase YwqF [Bacillus sp. CECT 9360]